MKNITLALDEALLTQVREVAAERRTTLNGLVREFLQDLAQRHDRTEAARRELLEMSRASTADMGPDWVWSREQSYER